MSNFGDSESAITPFSESVDGTEAFPRAASPAMTMDLIQVSQREVAGSILYDFYATALTVLQLCEARSLLSLD